MLSKRGIHVQLVTSAVREIPAEWHGIPRLSIVVSIDGLQPEHDVRRTPATYDRILKHIAGPPDHGALHGHAAAGEPAGLPRRVPALLVGAPEVEQDLDQPLHAAARRSLRRAAAARGSRSGSSPTCMALRLRYPKLTMPKGLIEVYASPPASPDECVFARTTTTHLGRPDDEDHAVPVRRRARLRATAAASPRPGLAAVGRHQLWGFIPVGSIFTGSVKVGEQRAAAAPGRVGHGLML